MIDITELQIGNLVKKVGETQPLPVLAIDSEKEYAPRGLKGTVTLPYIEEGENLWSNGFWAIKIEPLPITHDLLWCLGVEVIVLRGDGYSAYRFGEFHTLIGTKEGSWTIRHAGNNNAARPVEYIHQVQNAFFWLNQKRLTYTPEKEVPEKEEWPHFIKRIEISDPKATSLPVVTTNHFKLKEHTELRFSAPTSYHNDYWEKITETKFNHYIGSGNYTLDGDISPVLMPKIPNYTYWTLKDSL